MATEVVVAEGAASRTLSVDARPYAPILAFIAFFVPLRGLHDRLVEEKARLQAATATRLRQTIDALHQLVDWPWDPSTLRAVVSAIALPIGLFLITRVLDRFV